MAAVAIVDTGALVAAFDRAERHHRWAVDHFRKLDAPLLLCEPVIVETLYLLDGSARAHDAIFGLLGRGAEVRGNDHRVALDLVG